MTNKKIVSLKDASYIKLVNSLPSSYSIKIERKAPKLTSADSDWDEFITWDIDNEALDNPIGHSLIFNHVLTVLHHLQSEDASFREQLKDYVASELLEEIDHDSNFNR